MKRYPGIYHFEKKHKNIFFGRNDDIEKMLTMINVKQQITLNAKSGIGKTSLLNAGVLPRLSDNYVPIEIRFYAYNKEKHITPIDRIIEKLQEQFSKTKQNEILNILNENTDNQNTLWYKFKNLQLNNADKTYILVFDQFEELFHYPQEDIDEFKNQLHELLHITLPTKYTNNLRQKSKKFPEIINRKTLSHLQKEQNIKTIFAIRSDRLSGLNQLSDKLPNIQSDFYELKPLDLEQTKKAIENPAKKTGDFDSPKFEYEPTALHKIIDYLTQNGEQNVETTQLQIVCRRIEQNIIENPASVPNAGRGVSQNDIPDFKNIFFEFYNDAIKKVTQSHQPAARKLVEDELIRNQQRISLDGNICTDILPDTELQKLVNSHLLRAERNTVGGFSYELSHDTLVEPIFEAAEKRRAKEEEQRAEAERQEELRKEREKQKRQRQIIAIVSIAAVLSIAFGIFGFVQMKKAENTLNELTNEQYEKFMDNASRLKNDARYEEAIEMYSEAQKLIQNDEITDSIFVCTEKLKLKEPFLNNLQIIDSLLNKNEFEEALQLSEETQAMRYDQKTISETIKNIQTKAATFYFQAAKQMQVLGVDKTAKEYLEKALQFEPDNQSIIDFKQQNYPDE